MDKIIPYGKQLIDNKDINYINKMLKSDFLTTGPLVKKFESKINNYLKCKYSIVCNSGTSALHLAFLSINIKSGDVVIMPAINFIASFNICQILKAKIILADIDPSTGRMRPKDVVECIKKNKVKKVKAIVTMHLSGTQENIIDFHKLKKRYNCFLIEDACHAFGGNYKNKKKIFKIGCAKHADISTFSFHPIKTITTAEGGAVTTNNKKIYEKILLLRSHGMKKSEPWKHWQYDIILNGYNYRLSDLNCALGISQINKINFFLKKRKEVAQFYNKTFFSKKVNFSYPLTNLNINAWHLYIILINFKNINQKNKFFLFMKRKNVILQYHYNPIYKFKIGTKFKKLPGCEKYYKTAVSLPIFVGLNKIKQKKIINLIINYLVKNKIR